MPRSKPPGERKYKYGFSHVNFTEAEMIEIDAARKLICRRTGIPELSNRQALVYLTREFNRAADGAH